MSFGVVLSVTVRIGGVGVADDIDSLLSETVFVRFDDFKIPRTELSHEDLRFLSRKTTFETTCGKGAASGTGGTSSTIFGLNFGDAERSVKTGEGLLQRVAVCGDDVALETALEIALVTALEVAIFVAIVKTEVGDCESDEDGEIVVPLTITIFPILGCDSTSDWISGIISLLRLSLFFFFFFFGEPDLKCCSAFSGRGNSLSWFLRGDMLEGATIVSEPAISSLSVPFCDDSSVLC
jgi:hypothetical protein